MAEKKSVLQLTEGPICEKAKELGPLQAQMQKDEADLEALKKKLSDMVTAVRDVNMDKGVFFSLVRLASETAPVRVEFTTNKTSAQVVTRVENDQVIDVEKYLRDLLEGVYPQVFERQTIVTMVNDPQKVYDALVKNGKNPWDFLQVGVKDGADAAVLASCQSCLEAVAVNDVILPVKDWLENLTLAAKALSSKALTYMKLFIKGATTPRVVLSSKSRGAK